MFVFIDDLDRLDKAEIIEVIRLIRNTANFPNTVFIVAYDRNYVIEAIKGLNNHDATKYLEKIFQLEIDLPKSDVPVARNVLEDKLRNLCFGDNERKELDQIFHPDSILLDSISLDTILEGHYSGKTIDPLSLLLSVRDVNRLVNSFSLSYMSLEGEVVITDLLYLEILRMKFPQVFLMLYERKNEWLTNEVRNKTGAIIEVSYRPSFYLKPTQSSEGTDLREAHIAQIDIEDSAQVLNLSTRERQEAVQLLATIFDGYEKPPLSIGHTTHFEKYFAFRITGNIISEKDFSKARSSNQRAFNRFIDEAIEEGKVEEITHRFRRLRSVGDFELGSSDYELLLNGLVYLINKYPDTFSYVLFIDLVTIEGVAEGRFKTLKDFQNTIKAALSGLSYPFSLGLNVIHILKKKDMGEKILPISERISLLNMYWPTFEGKADNGFDSNLQSFVIALSGILKESNSLNQQDSEALKMKVIDFVKNYCLESLFDFLKNGVTSNKSLSISAATFYEFFIDDELKHLAIEKGFLNEIDSLMNRVNPDNL